MSTKPRKVQNPPQAQSQIVRQGPRPLALHMLAAATLWLGWPNAWLFWNGAYNNLKPQGNLPSPLPPNRPLKKPAPTAQNQSQPAENPSSKGGAKTYEQCLIDEGRYRYQQFCDGIEAYRAHPYRRDLPDPPVVWQAGSVRVLDYGLKNTKRGTILVVPSLVNRYHILDLAEGSSLLRWLAEQGWRPLVVDWGDPEVEEKNFALEDYMRQRLEPALTKAASLAGGKVHVLGYCMGGMMAVALAERQPEKVRSLSLLATPWDFHADGVRAAEGLFSSILAADDPLSVDTLQMLITGTQVTQVLDKFRNFANANKNDKKARQFVVVEDWLNDGVPLPMKVARECLTGWYGRNDPMKGAWEIEGCAVDPRGLRLPVMAVIPRRDRIVVPASAHSLTKMIAGVQVIEPDLGHIGMIVSEQAESLVWQPLAKWLAAV